MGKDIIPQDKPSKLRKQAEKKLEIGLKDPKEKTDLSLEEKDRLLHELQVHQIELEMQNEELRRIQLDLDAARDRYSDLYDFAPVGYLTVSEKGMILEANLTLAAMLGVARGSMIGKPFFRFLAGDTQDVYDFYRRKPFEAKHKQIFELKLKTKDGTQFWAQLECVPAEDAEVKMSPQTQIVVTDVSARKQIEKEKKILEAQIRQSSKMEAIGTLSGGIAHDFNNILYMIVGNAELALENIPEWNPVHANLEEINAAGQRAAGIVKQLLNFSRKTDPELKPIGAITVIKDALKFLRSTIPATIEIRRNITTQEVTILADPIQINQVLMNICTNASQAMEKTGGILEITVEKVTLGEEAVDSYPDLTSGDYLKIAVSDTGPGVDSEIIERIFDPYFTTKEVGRGLGMGLAVVLGIVKNHGAAISVDSQPGKGATFTILFPVVAEKPVMEIKTLDEIPRGNETILFVEDEKSIADMSGLILGRLGYTVETKTNPVEALELFQSKPAQFDLVITDMTMPQMSGVKLSENLKDVRTDIPIIICTGYSSLIDEKKAKKLGIAAYIMKPIVMSDIAKTIRNVLDAENEK
jgi:PAS domain S-box-containing protein